MTESNFSANNRLQLALDTNGLYTAKAGVARYITGLIKGLETLETSPVSIHPIAWERENFDYQQPWRALKTIYRELVWAPWIGARRLRRLGPDVFHATASSLVRVPDEIPYVVTIHDVVALRFPKKFRRWARWTGPGRLRACAKADRVICISQFTADEVIALLGIPASKIDVVWNGCSFHSSEKIPDETAPSEPVPGEFFLFVGSLEPAKNLKLLRDAYLLAESQGRPLPPLVLIGARWEGTESEGAHPKNWTYLGRQPDSVLIYLYRRALALVFPSLYEGFGLPLVEAMALQCPTICSPIASMKEIGAEGASYFVDQDPQSYIDGMRALASSDAIRQELIQAGSERVAPLSWRRCAEGVRSAYESAVHARTQ